MLDATSKGPAAATSATTGATSTTASASGGEITATGDSTAATCGIGTACTISAGANEPIDDAPTEMDTPLCLGLAAYTVRAAATPTAKMTVSTCSNTIFDTPVTSGAVSRLLMASQRSFTIASTRRTRPEERDETSANNIYIIHNATLQPRPYYDVSSRQVMCPDIQV